MPSHSRAWARPTVIALGVLSVPLLAGFFGGLWWGFDLVANFRPQLGMVLVVTALASWRFDRPAAGAMGLVAVVGLSSVVPLYVGGVPLPAGETIEVVTFNVGVSNPRRDEVAAWLAGEDPDLVFLFESSFEWEDAIRRSGLPLTVVSVVPRGSVAGVTVLASNSIAPRAIEVDVGGEVAAVSVRVGGTAVDVIGLHPPSPTSAARAASRDEMLTNAGDWVAERRNPVIVVGDFNATPWSAAYQSLRRRARLVDTLAGAGVQATWPDGWGPLSIPIDHILHTSDLGSSGRRTGPSWGSAHRPVLVSIGPADR